MHRYRRKDPEDEDGVDDTELLRRRKKWRASQKDEEEEEEEDAFYRRPRRSFSDIIDSVYHDDLPSEEIDEDEWEKLEQKIRAGQYKPKRSDHYTLHVLYQNLKNQKVI